MSAVLFRNARIIDGNGAKPYTGELLVDANRIVEAGVSVRGLPC